MRKSLRVFLAVFALIFVVSATGFVVWGETSSQPMPEALTALKSDGAVTVGPGNWLIRPPGGFRLLAAIKPNPAGTAVRLETTRLRFLDLTHRLRWSQRQQGCWRA